MFLKLTSVATLGTSLLLGGCASTPSTGDLMRQYAVEQEQHIEMQKKLAVDWERGNELVTKGNKRLEKYQKRAEKASQTLEEARLAIEQANVEIAAGTELIKASEAQFKDKFPAIKIQ